MSHSVLEHLNITVSDPDKTAAMLCNLFDWHIRWQGDAIHGGRTIHVGSDECYLAIYSPVKIPTQSGDSYNNRGGLNHVGIVVEDLDKVEERVLKAGFTPGSHADYEPGRRFYFHDDDNIEFEVVSYT
jgi:glyoxylase I family protein